MPSIDAPDWQRVVTSVIAMGDVPDAPDWERIVVAPGGQPVGPLPQSIITDWPPDQGFTAWSMTPWICNSTGTTLLNGQVNLGFTKATSTGTISHVYCNITGTVGTRVANENYMGVYTPNLTGGVVSSFTLQATSAAGEMDTLLGTTGLLKCPLTSSVSVVAGDIYYVAMLVRLSAGTCPQSWYNPGVLFGNQLNYPYTITDSSATTTLPPTLAVAGATFGNSYLWYAMGA